MSSPEPILNISLSRRDVLKIPAAYVASKVALSLMPLSARAAPASQASSENSVLVLADGLDHRIDTDFAGPEATWGRFRFNLFPRYSDVALFSPNGGRVIERTGVGPSWFPEPSEPQDSYQDISLSTEAYFDMINQLRRHFRFVDLMGFSLGGFLEWQYLITHVMPERASHHQGVIRSAALLATPLNGIPEARISHAIQEVRERWGHTNPTRFGNSAISYIGELGNEQVRTRGLNMETARILRDECGVRLMLLTNRDDCFTDPDATTLTGFGTALPLGRGGDGAPSCDSASIILTALSGGDVATKLGHTQILTHNTAQANVIAFLNH